MRTLGAVAHQNGSVAFRVWAPKASKMLVHLVAPVDRLVPMASTGDGYYEARADGLPEGQTYMYVIDGSRERPDPASRWQPEGVHGPSAVISDSFEWHDSAWYGRPLSTYVICEIHVGTFTAEGTFDGVVGKLDHLISAGITALELMPVGQFPGERNWGYDGVFPFAVQASYGGAYGLKRLVDACHQRGIAVIADVVYNHLGPEGNYLWDYGPYFTGRYKTPWGDAVNLDGEHSDPVRRYFLENALMLQREFHVDALRVDAVHAIHDESAYPFLQELKDLTAQEAERENRRFYVIGESDLNDPRVIRPQELGGMGLDAQWSDDFHHALHTLLTGEADGYYADFGSVGLLAEALRTGYAYTGQPSVYRRRRHGARPWGCRPAQFVVCAQNHDQIGNRMHGERLASIASYAAQKAALACVGLSPFVPMFFMGEEYGETAPFLYFVSHGDPELVEAVRRGRREEFGAFRERGEPPDPSAMETYERSKLRWSQRSTGRGAALLDLFRQVMQLRSTCRPIIHADASSVRAVSDEQNRTVVLWRSVGKWHTLLAASFGRHDVTIGVEAPAGTWDRLLDTAAAEWDEGRDSARGQEPARCQATTSALGSRLELRLAGCSVQLWSKPPPEDKR